MADHLLTELRDRVLYLTLNRPDKLNAMSQDMMSTLLDNLSHAATDPKIGAVVVTGAGRGFCARGEEASRLLHDMPKVTIAAINGPAAGAGLSLAMAADLRFAADNARLGTAFAKVGFSGDYGGTWSLTRLVGSAKARELYFLPDMLDAAEAQRVGLVNRVFPAASFRDEVHKLASRIANGPTVAYSYMKANLNLAVT